jgi:hypothetical protein
MAQSSGNSNSLLTLGLLAVGGYFVWEWFFATPATATSTTPAVPATPATPAATTTGASPVSTPAPTASGVTLDSLYSQMVALITKDADPNFTGSGDSLSGSAWQFATYLAIVDPTLTIPDPTVVFGSVAGATGPMTAASYWALMGPALRQANTGLSGIGLGCYAGAGAAMAGLGYFRW